MKGLLKTLALSGLPLFLELSAMSAHSVELILQWEPVYDQRVQGYSVHYGTTHLAYDQSVDVGNQTSYTFTEINPDVVYYFAVKAKGSDGQESEFPSEVTSGSFRYVAGTGDRTPNSGQLEVVNQTRVFEQKVPIGWSTYNAMSGEARTVTDDIDGDGKDELTIGMGNGSDSHFLVKRRFDGTRLAAELDPWQDVIDGNLSWAEYSLQHGETRPAVGDLNGDNKQEIVLGLVTSGGGNVEIFDYLSSALLPVAATGVDWTEYNDANGETRPAIGVIDRDRRGEIILGLGQGGGGYLELLDDARTQYAKIEGIPLGLSEYPTVNGAFWPPIKHERQQSLPERAAEYVLSLLKKGTGAGTVGGGGTYPAGTSVAPTASAASGSVFAGWVPSSCGGTFPLNADTTCTATFNLLPKYTLTVNNNGRGSIVSRPAGIDCGRDCTDAYVSGTVVALTATPATGYSFSSWSGACTGTGACSVTMSAARSVTATFTALPKYTLTIKPSGSGKVTSTPAGINCGSDCTEAYSKGTTVALNAAPATGYRFSGWSGACTGTRSCSVSMRGVKSVTATFSKVK